MRLPAFLTEVTRQYNAFSVRLAGYDRPGGFMTENHGQGTAPAAIQERNIAVTDSAGTEFYSDFAL